MGNAIESDVIPLSIRPFVLTQNVETCWIAFSSDAGWRVRGDAVEFAWNKRELAHKTRGRILPPASYCLSTFVTTKFESL